MRFLEILKTIRNKFIRKNPQTQPEDTQSTPEEGYMFSIFQMDAMITAITGKLRITWVSRTYT